MQEGTIKFFDDTKEVGSISRSDGSKDIFVHVSGLAYDTHEKDRIVYYKVEQEKKNLINNAQPGADLIRQARLGVKRRRVDEIARQIGLTDVQIARILNISSKSLRDKVDSVRLDVATSERFLLLEMLVNHGLSVFDGRADLFNKWLHTPFAELAYRIGGDKPPEPFSIRDAGSFTEPKYEPQSTAESADEAPAPQTPLSVMDTVTGFSLADDILGRIEWGIVG